MSSATRSILGVDFTSAPNSRKAITVARAQLDGARLTVGAIDALTSFADFEALLQTPGPWVGGFDFPFGLPRELVVTLGWPKDWPEGSQEPGRVYRTAMGVLSLSVLYHVLPVFQH